MEVAKVTSKGQITIPISIRRKLEINEGDKVLFIYKPDGVLMVNPNNMQGGSEGDVVEAAETEMAAEAVAAMKERSASKATSQTAPKPVVEAAPEEEAAVAAVTEKPAEIPVQAAPPRPVPPPVEEPEKPEPDVGGLNLGSLLDDIRSIGSNI